MGFTLDQLLETTGVDDLAGRGVKKIAAKQGQGNLLKLAERCRRAADVADEAPAVINERDLIEKAATVQIIRRTLVEIQAIENDGVTKTASAGSSSQQAVFIKVALEAGHSPESIARFLESTPGQPPALPEPKKSKSTTSIVR